MISEREARRCLDEWIEAARNDDDGKFTKKLGGKPLTILIHPEEEVPSFLWGEGETPVERHIMVQAIATFTSCS